ncbi:MAG: aldose 1-epimerase family protein [Candidatus Bathyarchaeia archaeon]
MRFYSKTLLDVENEIYVEKWKITSAEFGAGKEWCIEKRRLYGGPSDGVDIITVDNGRLSFTVVPTRGMSIWRGYYQGIFLGWVSPVKYLVNPKYVNLEEREGLGWLRGFNEWVVRCGLGNIGAPGIDVVKNNMGRDIEALLTLHGRIANTPASLVKLKVGLEPPFELGVEGTVYESTMFGSNLKLTTSITTFPGDNSLKISDTIENLRGVSDEMQILYHCNYGKPFLEEGARFLAPIKRLAPRDKIAMLDIDSFDTFGPPESGFIERVYFMELLGDEEGYSEALLVNKSLDKAVSHRFLVKELPFFTLWRNTAAEEDGYVVGFEPGTSFPNMKRFERERGRVIKLGPGEKYRSELIITVYADKDDVEKAIDRINKIKGGFQPIIYRKPIEEFSPTT